MNSTPLKTLAAVALIGLCPALVAENSMNDRTGHQKNPRMSSPQPNPQQPRAGNTQSSQMQSSQQRTQDSARTQSSHSMANNARGQQASTLIGQDVNGSHGDSLGEIKDFVIDSNSGKVMYAVVASGGVAGMGETLRAVPIGALNPDNASGSEAMRINMDQSKWDQAPTFERTQLASLTQDQRGRELFQYYGQTADTQRQTTSRTSQGTQSNRQTAQGSPQLVLATDVIGQDVRSGSQTVGEVDDVIVHLKTRSAAALLDANDEFAGTDQNYIVPFNKLNRSGEDALTTTIARQDFSSATTASADTWADEKTGYVTSLFVWPTQDQGSRTGSDRFATNTNNRGGQDNAQAPVAAVRQAVQSEARNAGGPTSVAVAANGDKVVLSGTVPTEEVKERIEERAEQAAQGWDIDNQIRVAQRR